MRKICFATHLKEIGRHFRTAKISKKTLIVSNKVVSKHCEVSSVQYTNYTAGLYMCQLLFESGTQ